MYGTTEQVKFSASERRKVQYAACGGPVRAEQYAVCPIYTHIHFQV